MTTVEWHGGKPYATCTTCGKPVRLNKPLLGSAHLCLTDCERAGRHLDPRTTRHGPPWRRRDDETYCARCGETP